MRPILFRIGEFTFPSYTLMIMIGILMATYFAVRICKSRGLPVIYALDMAILGILAGFAGARIGHILVEGGGPSYPHYYSENWLRIFYVWQGGFVSWSGYLAICLSWYFYLRWRKQPIWAYFDAAALVLPIGDFWGRAGCLLTGCCFGKPTDFFIHLTFSNPASTAYFFYPNTPLHATQIYLMLNGLFIAAVLWIFSKRWWRFQGQLFAVGWGLYAVMRFLLEFLRGDVDRGVYFNGAISSGQIAMIVYFLVAAVLYFYLSRLNLAVPEVRTDNR